MSRNTNDLDAGEGRNKLRTGDVAKYCVGSHFRSLLQVDSFPPLHFQKTRANMDTALKSGKLAPTLSVSRPAVCFPIGIVCKSSFKL